MSLPLAPPPDRAPRLWRDLLALAGGQLASKLLGFAAFAYLARTLAAPAYGAVEYAAGVSLVAAMFVDAGLSPIGVRRIARRPELAGEVSAEVLGARCLLAVASALALGASALWIAPDPLTARMTAVFAVGLLAYPWSQMWLFQAVDRIGWTAGIQTVRMGTFLAVVLWLVRETRHALWAGVAEIAGLALAGAFALALQQLRVTPIRLSFALRRLRALVAESLPIALANLVAVVTAFAPLLLAVHRLGAGPAAPFAAAHRLFFALATFSWIYHFNLFPVVAKLGADDERLRALIASSMRLVGWAGAAGALALTLVAGPLLATMFGAPFAAAAGAFGLLAWTLPLSLLGDHAGWLLIAHGSERRVMVVRLAGLAVAFGLGAPLVLARGPGGAAGALLAATGIVWIGLQVAAHRRLGGMPWTPALPGLGLSVAALVAVRALDLRPFAAAAIALSSVAIAALPARRTLLGDYRRLAEARARRDASPPDAQR